MTRKAVVLVPGVFGSVLRRGEDDPVWPPTLLDAGGFRRVDDLFDPKLAATDVVRSVIGCRAVYQSLLDLLAGLGFAEDAAAENAVFVWPYDWRKDLRASADALAAFVDDLAARRDEVVLIGHSMGGLVCRNMLESGRHETRRGLKKISLLLTLGAPHFGAPAALWQALGHAQRATIPAGDLARLAADPQFPSAYQMLPAPNVRALWDAADGLRPLNLYDAAVYGALRNGAIGLDAAQMSVAKAFWAEMNFAKRPRGVRYVAFAGPELNTITHMLKDGDAVRAGRAKASGDGVVPCWSAGPSLLVQTVFEGGEHGALFEDDELQAALAAILGAAAPRPAGEPPIRPAAAATTARLLLSDRTATRGEPIDVTVKLPAPAQAVTGNLRVMTTGDAPKVVARYPLRYAGPPLRRLETTIDAPTTRGVYALQLDDCPLTAEAERFMSVETDRRVGG